MAIDAFEADANLEPAICCRPKASMRKGFPEACRAQQINPREPVQRS